MMVCKYCGFDPINDSLSAEGAPCGYKGCMVFTCCDKTWKEHMERVHPEDSIYPGLLRQNLIIKNSKR